MASSYGTRRQSGNLLAIDTPGQRRPSHSVIKNVEPHKTMSGYAINRKSLTNSEAGDIYLLVPDKPPKRNSFKATHSTQERRESDASVTDFLAQASDKPYVSAALKGGSKRMTLGQVMPLANLKKLMMNQESMFLMDNTSSPQRRMNSMKAETGMVY